MSKVQWFEFESFEKDPDWTLSQKFNNPPVKSSNNLKTDNSEDVKDNARTFKQSIIRKNGKFWTCRLLQEDRPLKNSIQIAEQNSELLVSDSNISDFFKRIEGESENDDDKFTTADKGLLVVCGLYCQHTSSELQRNIISTILRQSYRK